MLDMIGEALASLDDVLSLKRPLAADSPADEEDGLAVKKDLRRSGYYDEPDYGLTPYPDKPLFEGIRAFQKDNKLKVDGVMKPGGETETALNRYRIAQADPLEARARDEGIVRQFIRAKNEERTQSSTSESTLPPAPPRKPERKEEIRLNDEELSRIAQRADEQEKVVRELFGGMSTAWLKRLPLNHPVLRRLINKTLEDADDIIGHYPGKIWRSLAEKQMAEKAIKDKRDQQENQPD